MISLEALPSKHERCLQRNSLEQIIKDLRSLPDPWSSKIGENSISNLFFESFLYLILCYLFVHLYKSHFACYFSREKGDHNMWYSEWKPCAFFSCASKNCEPNVFEILEPHNFIPLRFTIEKSSRRCLQYTWSFGSSEGNYYRRILEVLGRDDKNPYPTSHYPTLFYLGLPRTKERMGQGLVLLAPSSLLSQNTHTYTHTLSFSHDCLFPSCFIFASLILKPPH